MKKFISILIAILMLTASVFCFSGCDDNKNDDIFYEQVNMLDTTLESQANKWVDEEFLKDNRVKAYYFNENYVEGESDPRDKYIYDKTSPQSRVFIITNKDEYNKIFSNAELFVDFTKEIVILYIFSDVNPNRKYNLKQIEVNEKILTVQVELENNNSDDSTMPYQRCFMLKTNKVKIKEVEFNIKRG